jgi:N-formylglutamate amidohydrolase
MPATSLTWTDPPQAFSTPQNWQAGGAFAPATGWTDTSTFPRFVIDVNGDGLPDIVGLSNSCVYVVINTGSSFTAPASCWLSGGAFAPATGWSDSNTLPRFMVDVNGDGLPDIVGLYNSCIYVSLNTGSSFQPAACWLSGGAFAPATGWSDMSTLPRFLVDVNGDGLPDVVGLYNSCVYVSLNTGTSFQQAACWLSGGAFAPQTGWTNMNAMPRFLVDVTGDGLPDIVGIASNCLFVSASLGNGFGPPTCWLNGTTSNGAFSAGWTDMKRCRVILST